MRLKTSCLLAAPAVLAGCAARGPLQSADNVDMLAALADWVEGGRSPAGLQLVEQETKAPFAVKRSRPL